MADFEDLEKPLKEIFLPPFSELELLTLFYLISIFVIQQIILFRDHLAKVSGEIIRNFIPSIIFHLSTGEASLLDVLLLFVGIAGLFYLLAYIIYSLISFAITKRRMSEFNKGWFAYMFYILLAALSFFSTWNPYARFETNLTFADKVNNLIIYFVLIRSAGMGILAHMFSETMPSVLESRVTDKQIQWWELAILLLAGPLLFFNLRHSRSINSSLVLSYFYITSSIFFLRTILTAIRQPVRIKKVKIEVKHKTS